MKAKNLLKKLISTLLCVSTFSCAVEITAQTKTDQISIGPNDQIVRIFDKDNNEWGHWNLLTVALLNSLKDKIYEVCVGREGNKCTTYNLPTPQKSFLSKFGGMLLAPLGFIGAFSKSLFPLLQTLMVGGAVFMMAKSFIKETFGSYFNKNCGNIEEVTDPIEAIKKLDKLLESIKGQEKAKAELRRFVLNTIDDKNQRIRGLSKKKGAYIIYLVGASGVGKSMSAEAAVKAFTGPNSVAFIVEPSDIDRESKKASAVEQLFGMRTKKVNMNEIYEKSPLIAQIQATPNMVLIINEYDKMCTKELDEKLRTIVDQGYINVNGEKIDCSKLIIIITSNEDLGSVTKTEHQDDGTGSRTQVEHDKAFLNRLKIVEFNNLSAKNYVEIEKPLFELLQQRYLNDYNVFVTFEDGLLEKVAKLVEQKNQGARPIQNFIDSINDKLLNEVILKGSHDKSYKGKTINVSLNEDGDNSSFVLTETTDYKKVFEILVTKLKDLYSHNHNVKLEISDETINKLVKFLKENNGSTETAAGIIDALNKKIFDNIIAKDKKKKSYMGKSFKLDLNDTGWKISEVVPSQEPETVETTSKVQENSPETSKSEVISESEIEKQKAELKTLEGSKSDLPLKKETIETSIEAAVAA